MGIPQFLCRRRQTCRSRQVWSQGCSSRLSCQLSVSADSRGRQAYLCKILLVCHNDVVLQRNNDILVGSIFKVVGNDPRIVLLDRVIVRPTLLQSPKVPRYYVFPCRRDDRLFRLINTSVEPSWGEIDRRVHVCDVFWLELESAWNRFAVGWETSVETQ